MKYVVVYVVGGEAVVYLSDAPIPRLGERVKFLALNPQTVVDVCHIIGGETYMVQVILEDQS